MLLAVTRLQYLHNASAKTKAEALAEVNQLTSQLRLAIQRMEG